MEFYRVQAHLQGSGFRVVSNHDAAKKYLAEVALLLNDDCYENDRVKIVKIENKMGMLHVVFQSKTDAGYKLKKAKRILLEEYLVHLESYTPEDAAAVFCKYQDFYADIQAEIAHFIAFARKVA